MIYFGGVRATTRLSAWQNLRICSAGSIQLTLRLARSYARFAKRSKISLSIDCMRPKSPFGHRQACLQARLRGLPVCPKEKATDAGFSTMRSSAFRLSDSAPMC